MLRYMLDTNLCIATIRDKPGVARAAFKLHHAQMCVSSVTVMELLSGVESSAQPQRNLAEVEGFTARLDVLNLLRSRGSQVDYFYESRLRSEIAGGGVGDIHFHPLEPRSVRLTVTKLF